MKKFVNEFKQFVLRGNVMDLAVGVIIGAAFQSIVSSLVEDIITPIIGLAGGVDFSAWALHITDTVSIRYGAFITAVINFLIMAFVIFLLVKGINKLQTLGVKKEEAAPTTKKCPYCFSEIPIKATRCGHCTSQLPAEEEKK